MLVCKLFKLATKDLDDDEQLDNLQKYFSTESFSDAENFDVETNEIVTANSTTAQLTSRTRLHERFKYGCMGNNINFMFHIVASISNVMQLLLVTQGICKQFFLVLSFP